MLFYFVMIPRQHTLHYKRNFQIALICSLTIILVLFLFFPKIALQSVSKHIQTIFTLNDIPATTQSSEKQQAASRIPKTPVIPVISTLDDPEILNDVEIKSSSLVNNNSAGTGTSHDEGIDASSLPFVPRQIKEVLPQKTGSDVQGYIKLSLKIDKTGKVEKYILLVNSTNSSYCLQSVLKAAFQSRWQPAKINGLAVEYWIEKVYNFQ